MGKVCLREFAWSSGSARAGLEHNRVVGARISLGWEQNSVKILISAFLLAIPLLAVGQQISNEQELRQVFAYTQAYRQHLPSLECDETMLSQRLKNGKVKREVRIKATLRELRDENQPGGFRDEYTFKSVDGKPAEQNFDTGTLPYFVYQAFANGLGIGEHPLPACYSYRFATLDNGRTLQFNIDSKTGVRDPLCEKIPDDYHKMMLIDTASGAVRRVERRMSPQFADKNLEIPYITIDYAPQRFGDKTFWLPLRFQAIDFDQHGGMIATYSNCHRYTVVSKIVVP
jgi:hypothetical protein